MQKARIINLLAGYASLIVVLLVVGCGSSGTDLPTATDAGIDDTALTPTHDEYRFTEPQVAGATFYVDPLLGSDDGDGSADHPWRTLQQVIEDGLIEFYQRAEAYDPESELAVVNAGAPVKGGDRLLLRSGYHGHVDLNAFIFTDWLTIAGQEGHTPVLSQFKLMGAFEKIYLKNFTILKDSYDGPGNFWEADAINHNTGACLYLGSNSFWGLGRQVKINGLTVKTTEDASAWTADDWVEKSAAGISLRSVTDCEIVNCDIQNISFGLNIEYHSDRTTAVNNAIKYYSGDGCRLISNNVFLAYNTITDCLKVDDNHDDAIQSYSRGDDNSPGTGVLYDNVIRGNLIIGTTDFGHPLAGSPQGIGCFDGFFDGWIVENNVVIVDHYHGISFYGMRDSYILNNTVSDQNPDNGISPWIMVTEHKDGTPSQNCVVANNIAYRSISVAGDGVSAQNNLVIGSDNPDLLDDLFVDPDGFDYHLRTHSFTAENIIDQGAFFAEMVSSERDREDYPRDDTPDLGAYEAF